MRYLLGMAAMLSLAACGGGGGSSSSGGGQATTDAQGLYQGVTDTGRVITGVVLSSGVYYFLYGQEGGGADVLAGVVQGSASAGGGNFASLNAKDFNLEGLGVLDAGVTATYLSGQYLNGTVSYGAGDTVTFTAAYDADYELTPDLAAVAGAFAGETEAPGGAESADIAFDAAGGFAGAASGGCDFTGTIAPRSEGNVFNLSVTFADADCLYDGSTLTGIAYYDADAEAVYMAAPDAARSGGVFFYGEKVPPAPM